MGGVVRTVRKTLRKGVSEIAKAAGVAPTNSQIAAQQEAARRAQEQAAAQAKAQAEAEAAAKAAAAEKQRKAEEALKAQQAVQVVDAPGDPNNPDDVIYSGEQGADKPKKKRKKSGTIMTGSKGVIGDAPTEKSTLLGG
jgi:membrane protein involved in colicin uptake